jgi:hypothetical protein
VRHGRWMRARAVKPGASRLAVPWRSLAAATAAAAATMVAPAGPVSAQTRWSTDGAFEAAWRAQAQNMERDSRAGPQRSSASKYAEERRVRLEGEARAAEAQAVRRSREEQDRRARDLPWSVAPWSAAPWSATAWSDERRSR